MEKSPTSSLKLRLKKSGTTWEDSAGKAVVYIMSRDQRVKDNHALLAAQAHALAKKVPLAVVFCLDALRRHRAREHYDFMLSGLREVEADLTKLNIPFMMLVGDVRERLTGYFGHIKPIAVYCDYSPLTSARNKVQMLVSLGLPVIEVDTHNCVPVWAASNKQEVGARTLRPKIHAHLDNFLVEPEPLVIHPHKWPGVVMTLQQLEKNIHNCLEHIARNATQLDFASGEGAAHAALDEFIAHRLKGYAVLRNDPSAQNLSELSPYLHFGQLSSLRVVLAVQEAVKTNNSLAADTEALVEEIVVRKELSDNFCHYGSSYTALASTPAWAQSTLTKHAQDPREFIYTRQQFEDALTHDSAWNAAQIQLRRTGKMHGYMRMYWAKKVLEWSPSPQEAIQTLIYLNDFYSIDGGDPNGYVGILWSVAGLHDRPWGERPVYGTIRSMVYNGLKRKFDIAAYIEKYQTLA